jgi:hypothetical protein
VPQDEIHREAQGGQSHGLVPSPPPERGCRGFASVTALSIARQRMGEVKGKNVFVTVGTTKFDALIRAMDSLAIADELALQGYSELVMQVKFCHDYSEAIFCFTLVIECERLPKYRQANAQKLLKSRRGRRYSLHFKRRCYQETPYKAGNSDYI